MKPRNVINIAVLLFSASVFGQNADVIPDLKGLQLGITLEQFHDIAYGHGEFSRIVVGAFGRPKQVPGGPQDYWGGEAGERGYVMGLTRISKIPSTLGGKPAEIMYFFKKDVAIKKQSVLYTIIATFPTSASDAVLQGLTQKYGEPKVTETTKTSHMNVTVKGYWAKWSLSDGRYSIDLESIGDRIDEARLLIVNNSVLNDVTAKEKEAQSKDL
jgi:hypothetical protein